MNGATHSHQVQKIFFLKTGDKILLSGIINMQFKLNNERYIALPINQHWYAKKRLPCKEQSLKN